MKKTKVSDEEINRLMSSLGLIVSTFIENGYHGIIRPGRWPSFCFHIEHDKEGYWNLKKLLDDALELIEKAPDKYFPINVSIAGSVGENIDEHDIGF